MKKLMVVILSTILIISAAGCLGGKDKEADGMIGIRGQITKVTEGNDGKTSTILVEGKLESDTREDKASVRIDTKTKILKKKSGEKLSVSDLKEGVTVEVLFDGPVAESYPVQGKAGTIRVIE